LILQLKKEEDLDEASKAVIEAIRSPDLYQLDSILNIPIVKLLENSKHNNSYQLLKIFAGETLESYKTFTDKNPQFIASSGLNGDECLKKNTIIITRFSRIRKRRITVFSRI